MEIAGIDLAVTNLVLATGALGTAAFGIVEALKWTALGTFGFKGIREVLGPVMELLKVAYGDGYLELLKALFRGDTGELARVIRQGVRVGLTPDNAARAANFLGVVKGDELAAVAALILRGEELDSAQRNVLGRFELAVDTRIDAAITRSRDLYVGSMRMAASVVALGIAIGVAAFLAKPIWLGLLIGIAAVPLAPIANDVVTALQSASKALKARA